MASISVSLDKPYPPTERLAAALLLEIFQTTGRAFNSSVALQVADAAFKATEINWTNSTIDLEEYRKNIVEELVKLDIPTTIAMFIASNLKNECFT